MLLSIITVNYNDAKGLARTIISVRNQTAQDFEHIIIDGGSTDGSKEVIEQYQDGIKYWVSERDNGIYHAMNKGIAQASGEYVLFLNSGDYINQEFVLERINPFLEKSMKDLVYGNLETTDGVIVKTIEFPKTLSYDHFFKWNLGHPSTFIRASLFEQIGLYNEESSIVADWEFMTTAFIKHSCSYIHVPLIIATFKLDGLSSQPENQVKIEQDRHMFLTNSFPEAYKVYVDKKKLAKIQNNTGVDFLELATRPLGLRIMKWCYKAMSLIYKVKD